MKPTYDTAVRDAIRKRLSPPNLESVTEIARADSDEKHKAAFRQSLAKLQTSKADTLQIHCSAVSLPFLRRAFFTP